MTNERADAAEKAPSPPAEVGGVEPVGYVTRAAIEDFGLHDTEIREVFLYPKGSLRPVNEFPLYPASALSAQAEEIERLRRQVLGQTYSQEEFEESYETGVRDGYSDAVQKIDVLTGGDGEYRYCTDGDPERHTPDPATMIDRIVARVKDAQASLAAAKTRLEKAGEEVKQAYLEGREAWCPAGILSDAERTEREWQKSRAAARYQAGE